MTAAENVIQNLKTGRTAADRKIFLSMPERECRLQQLEELLHYRQDAVCTALEDDLGRSAEESIRMEFQPLLRHLRFLRKKFRSWCEPQELSFWKPHWLGGAQRRTYPCGQVLIAARWEYPLLDTLPAVASAFAAGNRVVLKLSQRTPQSMLFLRWLLEKVFPREEITVVGSELPLGSLLRERFDRIWFSGSSSEVQGVLALAAEHRTPVLSDSGSRNPCIIGERASLRYAAKCIVRSKFPNAGQSSSAVDALYVHRSVRNRFVQELGTEIRRVYGSTPLEDRTILPLVDVAAYEAVCSRIRAGRLLAGGAMDPKRSAVEPSVIDRIAPGDPLFTEDFHGPVLPLAEFSGPEELLGELARIPSVHVLYGFGVEGPLRREIAAASKASRIFWDQAPRLALVPGPNGIRRRLARELFDGFRCGQDVCGPSLLRCFTDGRF